MAPTPRGAAHVGQAAPYPPWWKAPRLPRCGRISSEHTLHLLAVVAAAAAAAAVPYESHQTIQASYHGPQLAPTAQASYHGPQLAPTAQASDHEPQLAPTVRLALGEERSPHCCGTGGALAKTSAASRRPSRTQQGWRGRRPCIPRVVHVGGRRRVCPGVVVSRPSILWTFGP